MKIWSNGLRKRIGVDLENVLGLSDGLRTIMLDAHLLHSGLGMDFESVLECIAIKLWGSYHSSYMRTWSKDHCAHGARWAHGAWWVEANHGLVGGAWWVLLCRCLCHFPGPGRGPWGVWWLPPSGI